MKPQIDQSLHAAYCKGFQDFTTIAYENCPFENQDEINEWCEGWLDAYHEAAGDVEEI